MASIITDMTRRCNVFYPVQRRDILHDLWCFLSQWNTRPSGDAGSNCSWLKQMLQGASSCNVCTNRTRCHSRSPDWNPKENIWDKVAREVYKNGHNLQRVGAFCETIFIKVSNSLLETLKLLTNVGNNNYWILLLVILPHLAFAYCSSS